MEAKPITPEDALAQPTRARLLALLCELSRSAGTDELAEMVGLHPNGVRSHLDRLTLAGLVIKSSAKLGKGRPRHHWAAAKAARGALNQPRAYEQLASWLSGAIDSSPERLAEIETAGRRIGREQAHDQGARTGAEGEPDRESGRTAVERAIAALGFQPELEAGREGSDVICLRNCPYREAVRENPKVICNLHRGMTLGLLEILDPGTALKRFVPRDPDRAGCLIELTVATPGPGNTRR